MASHRLSIRLPEPLRSGLEQLVLATGKTESELAREAIEEYLLRHTNPRHMQGFGE
jgi:predicted DNA-binding protein